ncbi:MAG: hypothetical protein AB7U81_04630 [Thiohalomonadaceae bacterium]
MSFMHLVLGGVLLALLLCALAGLGLLLAPRAMARIVTARPGNGLWSRLDKAYRIERFFYRHHRPFGALLLAGSAYTLYQFAASATLLDRAYAAWGPVGEAVAIVLVSGNLLAVALGAVVLLRPSLLRTPERLSNQWVQPPGIGIDAGALVTRHPRLIGALVFGGAIYALAQFARYLEFIA